MSEKTLFIEIFQPFAQYRNPFTFYYAQTYPLPPKSTVIGMLQNAIGDWYGKNEEYMENGKTKNRWWNLKVSVHGGFETTFWNYQCLIKGELLIDENGRWINRHEGNPGGNIWLPLYGECITSQRSPVYQQELFNGHLYIFIRGDEILINKIKASLENPKKILYLGRSEDVIFIKNVIEIPKSELATVEEDIKINFPTYARMETEKDGKKIKFPIKQQKFPVYYIPTKIIFKNGEKPVNHKAEITKSTERDVEFTTVIYTGFDYSIILNSSIEIENFEINEKLRFKIIKDFGWL